jgi:hypothetical protein
VCYYQKKFRVEREIERKKEIYIERKRGRDRVHREKKREREGGRDREQKRAVLPHPLAKHYLRS